MQHIDDGTLHAYLDGALVYYPAAEAEAVRVHLDECARCAGRLAAARFDRDAASAILRGADFEQPPAPPLEELRRRARDADAAEVARRGLRGYHRAGWAASVVLALGVGWMLRGGVGPALDGTGAAVRNVTGADALEADAEEADAVEADAVEAEEARALVRPAAIEAADPSAVTNAASGRDLSSEGGGASKSVEAARPAVVQAQPTAVAAGPPPAMPPPTPDRTTAAGSPGPTLDAPLPEAVAASDSSVGNPGTPVRLADREPTAAGSAQLRQAAPAIDLASIVVTGSEARRPVERDVALPRSDRAMRSRSAAQSGRREGEASEAEEAPLAVPGLPVISVSSVELTSGLPAVVILQLLAGGDTLEVTHLPAGSDPGLLPTLAQPDWTRLVVPHGEGWLVLGARMDGAALEALARRLQGS